MSIKQLQQSSQAYKNFLNLLKIQKIMNQKIKKSFGKLKTNFQFVAINAFYQSQFFRQTFDDANIQNQFAIFRQAYYGRPTQFICSPSSEFILALIMFSEKKFQKIKNQLLAPSLQEEMLIQSYNIISGQDSGMLQDFIEEEQKFFIEYCQKLEKQKGNFYVSQYLVVCLKRQNNNLIYFRKQFENFIELKYQKNVQQKGVFTLSQYSQYIWQNLILYSNQIQIFNYFNHCVDSFALYSKYCRQLNIQQSLLNFKMWKSYSVPFDDKSIKNRYFLVTFINSYIKYLIDLQNGGGQIKAKNWLQYLQYLKDYVKYMQKYNVQILDFSCYRQYFLFRKQFQKFYQFIKKSKEIVFNKQYIIEYMNKVFKQGTKLSNKNYKSFLQVKENQIKQKQQQLIKKVNKLKSQLQEQEGSKFYFTIFDKYIQNSVENDNPFNKQNYYAFKYNVLDQVSQEYIQNENEKLIMQMKNTEGMKQKVKQQNKKQIQISDSQEIFHQNFDQDEKNSQQQEQEDIENQIQVCPCCLGEFQDCQQTQCMMMGYCVTCSL